MTPKYLNYQTIVILVRMLYLFFLITIAGLINASHTLCAQFSATAYGYGYCDGSEEPWNPMLGNGLLGIQTASCSWNYSFYGFSGSSDAAVYGSDTSWLGLASHYAEGLSVEPMAHSRAHAYASFVEGRPCDATAWSSASALVSVIHRLRERTSNPLPSDLPNLFEILNNVPVRIAYRLSADCDGGGDAFASLLIEPIGIVRTTDSGTDSGTISFIASAGDTFSIEARSSVRAAAGTPPPWCSHHTSESAQAVADPFAYVDPDWEYAEHFSIEQTSLNNPGEWVEVTRKWQTFCEADFSFDFDGDVDGKDFAAFLTDFGKIICANECQSDYDEDGDVDENDLLILTTDFGKINCGNF